MKLITADLECSHSATFEAEQVPAQPSHKHLTCPQCGGGSFAAVRVTGSEDIIGYVVVDGNGVTRVHLDPLCVDPKSELGTNLAARLSDAVSGVVVQPVNINDAESPVFSGNLPHPSIAASALITGNALKAGDVGFGVVASSFKPSPEAAGAAQKLEETRLREAPVKLSNLEERKVHVEDEIARFDPNAQRGEEGFEIINGVTVRKVVPEAHAIIHSAFIVGDMVVLKKKRDGQKLHVAAVNGSEVTCEWDENGAKQSIRVNADDVVKA